MQHVIKYDEHKLPNHAKESKFNWDIIRLNENHGKKAYQYLIKDRSDPKQWVEFHDQSHDLYVVAYYCLGGYVVRLGKQSELFLDNATKSWLHRNWWYPKYKNSYQPNNIQNNLFSVYEVSQIVDDVAKFNKLMCFK